MAVYYPQHLRSASPSTSELRVPEKYQYPMGANSGSAASRSCSSAIGIRWSRRGRPAPAGLSMIVTGLNFGGNANTFFGTSTGNDFLTMVRAEPGRPPDRYPRAAPTHCFLGVTGGYSLDPRQCGKPGRNQPETISSATGPEMPMVLRWISGAGSNDGVSLANGLNTVSVVNVKNLNGSDFAEGAALERHAHPWPTTSAGSRSTSPMATTRSIWRREASCTFTRISSTSSTSTARRPTTSCRSPTGFFEPGNNPVIDLGGGDNTLNLGMAGFSLSDGAQRSAPERQRPGQLLHAHEQRQRHGRGPWVAALTTASRLQTVRTRSAP